MSGFFWALGRAYGAKNQGWISKSKKSSLVGLGQLGQYAHE